MDALMGDSYESPDIAQWQTLGSEGQCCLLTYSSGFCLGLGGGGHSRFQSLEQFFCGSWRRDMNFKVSDNGFVDVEHHGDRLACSGLDLVEALGLGENPGEFWHGDGPPVTGSDCFNSVSLLTVHL